MTTNNPVHRRRLLRIAGGIGMMGLAGCVGAPSNASNAAMSQGTPTPAQRDEQPATASSHDDDTDADSHDDEEPHTDDDHEDEETPEGHTPGDDVHGHEDVGHMHDEPVPDPMDHATVRMINTADGFHFEPHVTRINPGGSITFVNESGAHSATAYHPDFDRPLRMPEGAEPWDTGLETETGVEFEYTFDTEGVYQYYCIPHESMGMIGAFIVGEPDPHGQPGLAAPQAGFSDRAAEKIEELNEMCNEALGHGHD